jgi:hypothetical protein
MTSTPDLKFPATAVLGEAFRAYEDLAAASRALKSKYDRARNTALALGILAALAGVLASQLLGAAAKGLGIASAIFLALGGYVGKEFLTPSGETEWSKLRLRAETIKRDVWKAAMRVPPFDSSDAPSVLERELTAVSKPRPTVQAKSKRDPPPDCADIQKYLDRRVGDQVRFYRERADSHTRSLARLRRGVMLVGILAVVAGVLSSTLPKVAMFVSLLTTISGALVAVIQAGRLEAIVPLYRDTVSDLDLLVAKWTDEESRRAALPADQRWNAQVLLVMACEETMSRENSSWRTAWLDPAQLQASRDLLDKARAQAESAAGSKGSPKSG